MSSEDVHQKLSSDYSIIDFHVIKQVGEGAFSKVYLAKWINNKPENTPNFVAIKKIQKTNVDGSDLESKVSNEVGILSMISNEFLIKYYGSFESICTFNILLEYLPATVFNVLKKKTYLGESSTRYFSYQILLGLEYLHSNLIAYRDLKPENTMISSDWVIKLTDFSFSKQIPGRSYTCQGTLEYMAPEIVLNQGHGLAVDWWAFGVLLYELCAGYSPFKTRFQLNLVKKIISGKYQFPPHFTDELRDLVKRLLVVDPTERLGCVMGREQTLKTHPWFSDDTDWEIPLNSSIKLPMELRDINILETDPQSSSNVEILI